MLQRVDILKYMLPLPFGDVSNIDHIDLCCLIRKLILASIIGSLSFILVFAVILGFTLALHRHLASLFQEPTIPISMGSWFLLGVMDLARSIQDPVKLARSIFVPFKGSLLLSGSRAVEPCVNHGILGITPAVLVHALLLIVFGFAIDVAGSHGASFAIVRAAGQPAILSCAKVGHK